jgi:hypothetical protein
MGWVGLEREWARKLTRETYEQLEQPGAVEGRERTQAAERKQARVLVGRSEHTQEQARRSRR